MTISNAVGFGLKGVIIYFMELKRRGLRFCAGRLNRSEARVETGVKADARALPA